MTAVAKRTIHSPVASKIAASDPVVNPSFTYDPFSREAMRDPQPLYRRLRADYPAYFMPDYDAWAISRFADVWEGFLDPTHFTEAEGQIVAREQMLVHHAGVAPTIPSPPLPPFPLLDPPLHTRVRQLLAPPLLKGAVQRLRPLIEKLTDRRLDALLGRDAFDLNEDLAGPVSAGVICHLVGLPLEEADHLSQLVRASTARDPGQPGFTAAGQEALGTMVGMLIGAVALRRAGRGSDVPLIDAFLRRGIEGFESSDLEIAQTLVSIVVGGIETVPKILAAGIRELGRHPDQLAAILQDLDGHAPLAVEEMLRLHAPAQWFVRTVLKERTLAGAALKVGQRVILLTASANRDPREFDDPDAFIWNRAARRMISFGIGPHFCIGIHVARLELQTMVHALLRRMPRFIVDEQAGHWIESEFQIGWGRLPVRSAP